LDDDFVVGKLEHMSDDGLDFSRMLCGGGDEHAAVFTALRPGSVSLEIEMFLAAQLESSGEGHGGTGQGGADLAAPDEVRSIMETARVQRLFECEDGFQRFVVHEQLIRGGAAGFQRFA